MRFPKTQIVTFANQKGGCGKTSGSVSIAAAFAKLGYSVCLVDTDPQCNATEHLGVTQDMLRRQGLPSLADIYLAKRDAIDIELDFDARFKEKGGNLCLIPGHTGLSAVEARLSSDIHAKVAEDEHSILDEDEMRDEHRFRLKKSLDTLRGHHDVVILDTPPELGFLMTTALIAADWYIIPVFPSAFDLKGLEKLSQTVEKIRKRYNPDLRLGGVILGNFDKSTKLDGQVHQMLKDMFGEALVFKTVIGRGVRNREATFNGLTIFEHAPNDPASDQYLTIVREMLFKRQSSAPTRLPPITETPRLPIADSMADEISEEVVNG